jgi:cellulose synthase/poly-beta-1,6-N-acetylglucosamine synthase-like glycosyltransferase
MAIAIDPIFSNILFTINFIVHRKSSNFMYKKPSQRLPGDKLPIVSILLPFFNERIDSILATIKSITSQTYPKDKLEIIFIVESDDGRTRDYVEKVGELLKIDGLSSRIVISDGKKKIKPYALNFGVREAKGEIVVVYDADDDFDGKQIEDAISLMLEGNYDVVMPKIYRHRKELVGRYLMLDTVVWNEKFLPTLYSMGEVFPLSGEGLFIKKSVLEEIGGFPEVLTEDAYLSIHLAEKGKRFALLDSTITEKAPKTWRSHFKQRLRWFRGYITCCFAAIKSKIPFKKKLILLIPFLAPFTCSLSLFTWTFLLIYWLSWAHTPTLTFVAPWMQHSLYWGAIYYWSAFLAYIGNPVIIYSYMRALADSPFERYAPLSLIVPFYWFFIGIVAMVSFFKSTKVWGKTER